MMEMVMVEVELIHQCRRHARTDNASASCTPMGPHPAVTPAETGMYHRAARQSQRGRHPARSLAWPPWWSLVVSLGTIVVCSGGVEVVNVVVGADASGHRLEACHRSHPEQWTE